MARLLAFEWDDHQLCGVVGTTRSGEVHIEDIFSRDLPSGKVDDVATALKSVSESGLARGCKMLVALGRGGAELRRMHLPPMPDEELPDAVRFQAIRQFASAGEKATIDFLPIARSKEGIDVLAAAVGPDTLSHIDKVAVAAEREISGIYLRPLGVSQLMRTSSEDHDTETLLIDMLDLEADFVVLRNGRPIFVRSIRLPSEPEARTKQLASEVRRSLTACHQTEGHAPTRRIVIWGSPAVHDAEAERLRNDLNLPVDIVDPFDLVKLDGKLRDNLPEHRGRYAPLLGLIAAGGGAAEELIDFKHPRKRPEQKSQKNRLLAYAGIAALLLMAVGYMAWSQLERLDGQIAEAAERSSSLDRFVEQATASQADLNVLTTFRKSDVFWLNEMKEISELLPPGEEVILSGVTMNANPRGGGTIVLRGSITDTRLLAKMEESLRNEYRRVQGDGATSVRNQDPYNYQFTEVIGIAPEGVSHDPPTTAADATGATESDSGSEPEQGEPEPEQESVLEARTSDQSGGEITAPGDSATSANLASQGESA